MDPREAKDESGRCWKAAMKTRRIAGVMSDAILPRLDKSYRSEITNIIYEMCEVASLLVDCADLILAFRSRQELFFEYINIFLPSITRTNRYLWEDFEQDDDFLHANTATYKWDKLLKRMREEVKKPLHDRFVAYKCFLTEIVHLIQRPSLLQPTNLNAKMKNILLLLDRQGIPHEGKVPQAPSQSKARITQKEIHWAQLLFPYEKKMIALPQIPDPSMSSCCYDVPCEFAAEDIPLGAPILFRLTFHENRLSVIVYLVSLKSKAARIWCRWRGDDKAALYASQGLHELRMERAGSSLIMQCYNDAKQRPEKWLQLYFKHWEEMVLFHDAFAALKQVCPDTVECDPEELMLQKEKVLFKGSAIIDDGNDHALTLYTSKTCGGARLAASIRTGNLKRSPVWTAFLGKSELKKDNIKRKTDRTVVINKLAPLVTCHPKYYDGVPGGKSGYAIKFKNGSETDEFVEAWKDLVKDYSPRRS